MKKHLKLKKTCIVKHRRICHEAKKVLEWPASCSRRSGQTNTFRHPERQESALRNDPSTPLRKLHPKTAKKAPKRYVVVSIWIDFGQNPGPATHRDSLKKSILEQFWRHLGPPPRRRIRMCCWPQGGANNKKPILAPLISWYEMTTF